MTTTQIIDPVRVEKLERLRDCLAIWLQTEPESIKYPGMQDEEALGFLLDAMEELE